VVKYRLRSLHYCFIPYPRFLLSTKMGFYTRAYGAVALLATLANGQSIQAVSNVTSGAPMVDLGYVKYQGVANTTAGINYFRGIQCVPILHQSTLDVSRSNKPQVRSQPIRRSPMAKASSHRSKQQLQRRQSLQCSADRSSVLQLAAEIDVYRSDEHQCIPSHRVRRVGRLLDP